MGTTALRASLPAFIVLICLTAGSTAAQTVRVDCDQGGDLGQALGQTTGSKGPVIVDIVGTCVGNFVFTNPRVTLRGQSPETSAIVARFPGPVLTFRGEGSAGVQSLTVSGGSIGVLFERGRSGSVTDSVVRDNGGGIIVSEGSNAFVSGSVAESNLLGIGTQFRSSASIVDTVVRDNTGAGLDAFKFSDLALTRVEVSGNGAIGLSVSFVSSANVFDSTFSNHTEAHVGVRDRSTMNLSTGTVLGSATDPAPFAAIASRDSQLRVSSADVLHGLILTSDRAFVSLASTSLQGSLVLDEFSSGKLFRTDVSGIVLCEDGGDAVCLFGADAVAEGCRSAAPGCRSPADGAEASGGGLVPARPDRRPTPSFLTRPDAPLVSLPADGE